MSFVHKIRDYADIASKGFKVPPIYLFFDYIIPGFIYDYLEFHKFNFLYFLILTVSIMFLMASTNLFDDYFDYQKNIDVEGSPTTLYRRHPFHYYRKDKQELLLFAIITILIYFSFFIFLAIEFGIIMIIFAFGGALLGYGYTGIPIGYKYRGLGLIGAFVSTISIPLIVNYFYLNSISIKPLIFAIPYGILISATLYISDFRDRDFDSKINMKTLPVLLGKYSRAFFHVLFATFYASIAIFVIFRIYPEYSMILFLTLPLNHIMVKNLKNFSIKNMEFIFGNFIFLTLTLLSSLLILS